MMAETLREFTPFTHSRDEYSTAPDSCQPLDQANQLRLKPQARL